MYFIRGNNGWKVGGACGSSQSEKKKRCTLSELKTEGKLQLQNLS